MSKKVLLLIAMSVGIVFAASAQSTDARLEMLKAQVKLASETEGRDKALALALLGYDFLAPNDPAARRLLYETYYTAQDMLGYEEGYVEEQTFADTDWSRDGAWLAVGVSNSTVRLYNARTPGAFETITIGDTLMPAAVLDVAFSPDGRSLVYATAAGEVGVLDLATQKTTQSWSNPDYIRAIKWSPDGKMLAAGGDEKVLKVYRLGQTDPVLSLSGHNDWIRAVSWSADSKWVATASDDFTARVWSATTGALLKTCDTHTDYCRDAAFAPRGMALATVSDDLNIFHYEDVESSKTPNALKGHESWIMAVTWAPDGKTIATADNGGTIILHPTRGGDATYYNAFEPETPWMDLDFAPDGKAFAATSPQEIAIYQVGTATPAHRLMAAAPSQATPEATPQAPGDVEQLLATLLPTAQQLFPNANRQLLGVVDDAYQLQVVDMQAGRVAYQITTHSDWIRSVSWSPDGRLVATGSDDKMVGIWDAKTGAQLHFLEGHTDWVRSVAFSPDGKILASASDDGMIRFWDPLSGAERGMTESIGNYVMEAVWSPDQRYIAGFGSDGFLHVWDARTYERIFANEEMILPGSLRWTDARQLSVQYMEGHSMVWTPDGGMAPATQQKGATMTNAKGQTATAFGAYIAVSGTPWLLEGHRAPIHTLAWAPDGVHLVSQSVDGSIGIWAANAPAPLAMLNLTDGSQKAIVWSTQGNGFYLPGAAGKLMLPTDQLRAQLSPADYDSAFTEMDVLYYQLDKIFLNDPAIVAQMKGKVGEQLSASIAQYFATRAQAQPNPQAKAADEQQAAAFRQ